MSAHMAQDERFGGLLQLDLIDAHGVAVHITGHIDFNVFTFLKSVDEFFSLGIAGFIKLDDLFVVCQDAETAFGAFIHLQAIFAVLGTEVWLVALLCRAAQVHQIPLHRGIGGKPADGHRHEQN
jgi:hypothetical protein